ncbi:hypothetical protein SAQUA_14440 [Serratia aquatilis]
MNPAKGDFADMQRSKMSIPHYAEPRDIAGLVAWLASEEGRYVTGTGITINKAEPLKHDNLGICLSSPI